MSSVLDLSGKQFGRVTVLRRAGSDIRGSATWVCKCECGTEWTCRGHHLRCGDVVSCGCRRKVEPTNFKHGCSGKEPSPEYRVWLSMLQRCNDPGCHAYLEYGGRGIKVCQSWSDNFVAFLQDMGQRPSDAHSLDRIDVNGNYEPSNCRWATKHQQARNTRANRVITFDGKSLCLAEWSEITGISQITIKSRLRLGWSVEEALTLPPSLVSRKLRTEPEVRACMAEAAKRVLEKE